MGGHRHNGPIHRGVAARLPARARGDRAYAERRQGVHRGVVTTRSSYIDPRYEVCLCGAGSPGMTTTNGSTTATVETLTAEVRTLMVAEWHAILLEAGQILAAEHRCGRRTKAEHPCRMRAAVAGAACGWHRTGAWA